MSTAVKMSKDSKDDLVLEHMTLIKHIAHRIAARLPANIEMRDLVHNGVVGLFDAIAKFDPARDIKFKAYAEFRIRGAILDSLRNEDWASRSVRKRSKDMEAAFDELGQKLGRAATHEEVAEFLGIAAEQFDEASAVFQHWVSLDAPICPEDDSDTFADFVAADEPGPHEEYADAERAKAAHAAIDTLTIREKKVLLLFYWGEVTMKKIGLILGVNESRISQMHKKAVAKLRRYYAGHRRQIGDHKFVVMLEVWTILGRSKSIRAAAKDLGVNLPGLVVRCRELGLADDLRSLLAKIS